MRKKATVSSSPLTFDMPASLRSKIASKVGKGVTQSDVIRHALSSFDARAYNPVREEHSQVSVRIGDKTKAALIAAAKRKGISIGELLRAAIEVMPALPKSADASTKAKKK